MEKNLGFYHLEGDSLLTVEMRRKISEDEPFMLEEFSAYIRSIIAQVYLLKKSYSKIVISQGLFLQQHRDLIANAFPDDELNFFQINASEGVLDARVQARFDRGESKVTPGYAKMIAEIFEKMGAAYQIDNSQDHNDAHLLLQLRSIRKGW